MSKEHITVLLDEAIQQLDLKENGIYIDGTLGRGGHSSLLLEKLVAGKLFAFDKDNEAIENVEINDERFEIINNDFRFMKDEMNKRGIESVDGILLDIGVSSPQFDKKERGFSYRFDDKLDMRMNREQKFSAYELVNEYSKDELARVFFEYGEEKFANRIADNIVKYRANKALETTFELVDIIKASLPHRELNKKGHPAKKVFQAIRIEVNDELGALEQAINEGSELLGPKGRFVIITFHSLEDRIVKRMFNKLAKGDTLDKRVPIMPDQIQSSDYEVIIRKPILASRDELEGNKRSRSAKLRVLERA